MKKILRKATFFALLLGTLSANATGTGLVSEDATVVEFGFVREGSQIFIKDSQDYLLYKFKVKETGQSIKSFDFTTLPNGNYRFEVHEDRTIQIRPFEVTKGKVTFEELNDYTFFKPIITPKEDNITLTCFTLKNDPLEVTIYDEKDRLLYKEKITKNTNVKRVFNMSQVKDENVVFRVKVGDRNFSKRIVLSH